MSLAAKLAAKLAKNSKLATTAIIEDSKFFNNIDKIFVPVPILRLALSGELDGFFIPGATMFAGPSKHGKSILGMLLVKAYLEHFKDSVCLFFDSEFGTPKSYFNSMGIDMGRVVHSPIKNIEELKFDLANQLEAIEDGEKVIVFIDSIGNTASKKEVDDALAEKGSADMTRAKQLKSLFRIATPYLRLKNIPMVVINHTYQSQDLFPKTIVGGGTGAYYSCDNIFVMGRQQEKVGDQIVGWSLIMNVEKSRHCIEKTKFPIDLNYEKGLNVWSGLLEVAQNVGYVVKPSNGWYSRVFNGEVEDKKYRLKDTNTAAFWNDLMKDAGFLEAVKDKYKIGTSSLIHEEDAISTEYEVDE